MESSVRFKVNKPKVIHESFDDEVVIVNLDSGVYYSLDKIGLGIWDLVERCSSVGEVVESVSRQFEGSRPKIEKGIDHFLGELQREGLIVPFIANETEDMQAPKAGSGPRLNTTRESFQMPVLQKYADLQELLLLDAIHDVDEAGWPLAKQ